MDNDYMGIYILGKITKNSKENYNILENYKNILLKGENYSKKLVVLELIGQ